MRCGPKQAAAVLLTLLTHAALAAENETSEAPFGLTWGPLTKVSRPVKADREANLTMLYYPRGSWPAIGARTAEVVQLVCRDEGLQQVIWVGLPMSGAVLATTRRAVRDEGVRRYGEPSPGPISESKIWLDGRALLASREAPDGQRELVMTADGPGYATRSEAHRAATGHPAGAHAADLINLDRP